MTTDLTMLAWAAGFTAILWIPYIVARIQTYGSARTLAYTAEREPLPVWAERAKKAHYNAVENLAPFAALVLVAQAAGVANSTTAMASVVYFWARVAHYLLYISGIPYVRTLTFTIGWIAMAVIFYVIVT
jgi:uncharacterized MAPEG superfamily protein